MGKYEQFIVRFRQWAQQQNDIHGAFIIGSYGQQTATAWSDIDIAFLTEKPNKYIQLENAFKELGQLWTGIHDPNDPFAGLPMSATAFCVFEEGLYVDFAILPYRKTRLWWQLISNPILRQKFFKRPASETAYMLQSGIDILFDKTNSISSVISALQYVPIEMIEPPGQQEIAFLEDDFYLGILHMLRYLMKGQVFGAQIVRDKAVRRGLVIAAQWAAQSQIHNWNAPLTYRDRKIETWAHPQFVENISTLFNGYDAQALWKSLHEAVRIFQLLIAETLSNLHYPFDDTRGRQLQTWIEAQYEDWHAMYNNQK